MIFNCKSVSSLHYDCVDLQSMTHIKSWQIHELKYFILEYQYALSTNQAMSHITT